MPLPTSWLFHKLRRRRTTARTGESTVVDEASSKKQPPMAAAPCSPNRASYYFPSRERCRLPPPRAGGAAAAMDVNPKLRETRFPPRSPQPNDIVFDVVAVSMPMPELKLRPIVTKRAAAAANNDGEAASPPMACRVRRLNHAKPNRMAPPVNTASRRRRRRTRRCRWLYESMVVEKESAEPEEDFLASMEEMIAAANDGDGVRSPRDLEELLACYLALNAAEHHRAIVGAFRRVWLLTAAADAATNN